LLPYNTITWQGEWTDLKGLVGSVKIKELKYQVLLVKILANGSWFTNIFHCVIALYSITTVLPEFVINMEVKFTVLFICGAILLLDNKFSSLFNFYKLIVSDKIIFFALYL